MRSVAVVNGEATTLRFIVIDDSGGEDTSVGELRRLEGVTVLTTPMNVGHQRALVFGLRIVAPSLADSDIIVTLDSDGEDQPQDVPRLLAQLGPDASGRWKLLLARRTSRQVSIKFRLLYFGFQILFKTLTGTIIRTGNFACGSARVFKRIITHPSFDRCYSSTLVALKINKEFVPCVRGPRYAGRSRMSTTDLAIHGFRMLMPFIDRIAIRFLMATGILLGIAIGTLALLLFVHLYFQFHIALWAYVLSAVSVLVSSLFFVNFIVLFTVYSQSQSIALQGLEDRFRAEGKEPHGTL